jgi:hypothetical protein
MQLTTALHLLGAVGAATALSPADWRAQSIYQLLTDRFARTDGSTTATCNTQDGVYCGGSWQGVIDKLDYIQNMGFTAVCGSMTSWRGFLGCYSFSRTELRKKAILMINRSGYHPW